MKICAVAATIIIIRSRPRDAHGERGAVTKKRVRKRHGEKRPAKRTINTKSFGKINKAPAITTLHSFCACLHNDFNARVFIVPSSSVCHSLLPPLPSPPQSQSHSSFLWSLMSPCWIFSFSSAAALLFLFPLHSLFFLPCCIVVEKLELIVSYLVKDTHRQHISCCIHHFLRATRKSP